MTKTLIIYYSFEGSTKLMAETIKKELDAKSGDKTDILELKAIDQPKSKGFSKYFWGGRMAMMKKTPELEKFDLWVTDYDFLIIGTPVWAWTFTPPLRTFFNNYKFSGKKIALFICHDGGPGKTFEKMEAELHENEIIAKQDFEKTAKNKEKNVEIAKKWAKSLK
ncbi:flavodoxin [Candidatus Woesearchaeota archaeon]|jgi:flavodoxin|nr:flavodoxin [Candidatus Woesearchaeota archaeon]